MTSPGREKPKQSGLFFLVGCAGCGFLLLLVGVGGTMGWLLWQQNRSPARDVIAGWHDSLRTRYRLPDLVMRLGTPPTDTGDASPLLETLPDGSFILERQRAVRHLLTSTLTADDSAAIRGALEDPAARQAARAARRTRYEPGSFLDESRPVVLMRPLGPGLRAGRVRRAGSAVDPLILRGEARRWRGDLRGAREDFSAVIALGRLSWFGETTRFGPMLGRRAVESGAAGLKRVAGQLGDAALAARADSLEIWAARSYNIFQFVMDLPMDSILVIAGDSSLPRGVRAAALEDVAEGSLYRPMWRLITGPSNSLMAGVRALTLDRDPYVARAALMADSTMVRLDDMGIRNRYRVAAGKSVR